MQPGDLEELDEAVKPESLVAYVRRQARLLKDQEHAPHGPMESIRTAAYQGRQIVIRTTYIIEVDGVRLEGHVGVNNDGEVHYHPVPNVSYPSAIDLVKRVIDTFPDEFPPKRRRHATREEEGHGNHPS
ncbi:MAG: hypothetical protein EXR50_04930 [Dehalococcoidia bacterium]|nr:hypothetical protein [Dehalococcoidia bacterium]